MTADGFQRKAAMRKITVRKGTMHEADLFLRELIDFRFAEIIAVDGENFSAQ